MRIGAILSLFAAFVLMLVGALSINSVDAGERGLKMSGGQITSTVDPGWVLTMPWQSVKTLSFRTITSTFEAEPFYSKDQQSATAKLSITWTPNAARVKEIYELYGTIENMEKLILQPRVRKEFKEVMGQYTAQTTIQERERMGLEVEKAISVSNPNMTVESVQVENIDFSDTYEKAIDARMQAEVSIATATQKVEAEKKEAERVIAKAKGMADATLAQKTAEADGLRLQGEAEALAIKARGNAEAAVLEAKAKILAANPLLVQQTKAERWNGTLPTHVVPDSSVPFIDVK